MKKIIPIILSLTVVMSGCTTLAEEKIKVTLDGQAMDFDVAPIIQNDRVLVPMRAIFEELHCSVDYTDIDGKQIITAKNDSNTISLEIGSNEMTVNDEKVSLDTAPVIIDDRTLVPLRAVSEALDCNVDWDGDTKTVAIAPHKYNEYYTQKLMENLPKDENYVISPFSLEMAMMMASEGAVGDTKQEITQAFDSPNTSLYSQIITDNKNKGIDIAISIWFNKDSGENAYFADDYQKKIQSDYQGNAQSVTNDDSIEMVNEWVEKQTNGKITNITF